MYMYSIYTDAQNLLNFKSFKHVPCAVAGWRQGSKDNEPLQHSPRPLRRLNKEGEPTWSMLLTICLLRAEPGPNTVPGKKYMFNTCEQTK